MGSFSIVSIPSLGTVSVVLGPETAVHGFPNFQEAARWVMAYMLHVRDQETEAQNRLRLAAAALLEVERPQ